MWKHGHVHSLLGLVLATLLLPTSLAAEAAGHGQRGSSSLEHAGGLRAATPRNLQATPGQESSMALQVAPVDLLGVGSSFPEQVYEFASFAYKYEKPHVTVHYSPLGIGPGRSSVRAGTVDFGAGERDFARGAYVAQPDLRIFPTMAGAVAIVLNLEVRDRQGNVTDTPIVLRRWTSALVFIGVIKRWNDRRLVQDNPGLTLPDLPIKLMVRGDDSGTNSIFTQSLRKFSGPFRRAKRGCNDPQADCGWPDDATRCLGSKGMAACVATTPGAIGYVGLGHALQNDLRMAAMINRGGRRVLPSARSVAYAMMELGGNFTDGVLKADLSDARATFAWPITGYTYTSVRMESPRANTTCEARGELVEFWQWFMGSSSVREAAELKGFSPLPAFIRDQVVQSLRSDMKCDNVTAAVQGTGNAMDDVVMAGSDAVSVDIASTLGPAFKAFAPRTQVQYSGSSHPLGATLLHRLPQWGPPSSRLAAAILPEHTLRAELLSVGVAAPLGMPAAADILPSPLTLMGVALVYNVPGVSGSLGRGEEGSPSYLTLPLETVVGLFTGAVTHWNDSAIAAANPLADLPGTPVTLVVPAYACTYTQTLTAVLGRTSPAFAAFLQAGGDSVEHGTPDSGIWAGLPGVDAAATDEAEWKARLQGQEGAFSFWPAHDSLPAEGLAVSMAVPQYRAAVSNHPGVSVGSTQEPDTPLPHWVHSWEEGGQRHVLVTPTRTSVGGCAGGNTTAVAVGNATAARVEWDGLVPWPSVVAVAAGDEAAPFTDTGGWAVDFSAAPDGACWPFTTTLSAITMASYASNSTRESRRRALASGARLQGAVQACTQVGWAGNFLTWLHDTETVDRPASHQLLVPLSLHQHGAVVQSLQLGLTCDGLELRRLDVVCRPGEQLVLDPTPVCVPCPTGRFSLDRGGVCEACPIGGVCAGGSHLSARPGYWQSPSRTFHSCKPTSACCPAETQDRDALGVPLGCTLQSQQSCNPARDPNSVLCGGCAEGFSNFGSACVVCEESNVWVMAAMYFGSLIAVACLLVMRQLSSPHHTGFQLVVAFLQMSALLMSQQQLEKTNLALIVLDLSPLADLSTLHCLFPMSPELAAFFPIILILVMLSHVGVLIAIEACLRWAWAAAGRPTTAEWLPKYNLLVWRLSMLSFIAIVLVALQMFNCIDVDGVQLLDAYPAVMCGTPVHNLLVPAAFMLLVLFMVLAPIAVVVLIYMEMRGSPLWDTFKLSPMSTKLAMGSAWLLDRMHAWGASVRRGVGSLRRLDSFTGDPQPASARTMRGIAIWEEHMHDKGGAAMPHRRASYTMPQATEVWSRSVSELDDCDSVGLQDHFRDEGQGRGVRDAGMRSMDMGAESVALQLAQLRLNTMPSLESARSLSSMAGAAHSMRGKSTGEPSARSLTSLHHVMGLDTLFASRKVEHGRQELAAWARPGVRLWYAPYFQYRRIIMVVITVFVEDALVRGFLLFLACLGQLLLHVTHWPYTTKFDNLLELLLTALLTCIGAVVMVNSVECLDDPGSELSHRVSDTLLVLLTTLLAMPATLLIWYFSSVTLPVMFGLPALKVAAPLLSRAEGIQYRLVKGTVQEETLASSLVESSLADAEDVASIPQGTPWRPPRQPVVRTVVTLPRAAAPRPPLPSAVREPVASKSTLDIDADTTAEDATLSGLSPTDSTSDAGFSPVPPQFSEPPTVMGGPSTLSTTGAPRRAENTLWATADHAACSASPMLLHQSGRSSLSALPSVLILPTAPTDLHACVTFSSDDYSSVEELEPHTSASLGRLGRAAPLAPFGADSPELGADSGGEEGGASSPERIAVDGE